MIIFTLACPKGHTIELEEDEARERNGTSCEICYGPLLVRAVRT